MSERRSRKKASLSAPVADPLATAAVSKLRYVTDEQPGIRRRRAGKGFSYIGPDGRPLRDQDELQRIKSLAIPPAWADVWICSSPNGHLQATGRDSKGRKQYRYHPRWREVRDETKFNRMIAFGRALPLIRKQVEKDLQMSGLTREKVLATVVKLLETTLIRVGNQEYVRANGSFGLTTMRSDHVEVSGSQVQFRFRGKSGKHHTVILSDRRLASIVKRCRELPGHELFTYEDDEGEVRRIDSDDVNEYLRQVTGEDFTAKDFRTWGGTVLAATALADLDERDSEEQIKNNLARAVESVAAMLGNTSAICRKCYIHPAVIEAYMNGLLPNVFEQYIGSESEASPPHELRPEEAAVISLLEQSIAREEQKSAA